MAERSRWTDARMDDFVAHINARFDQVDARLAHLERRFELVEARLGRVEIRLDRLAIRVERLTWVMAGMLMTQIVMLAVLGYLTTQV